MPGAALDRMLQHLLQRDEEGSRELERLAEAVDAVAAQQASLHASIDGLKHQLEQARMRAVCPSLICRGGLDGAAVTGRMMLQVLALQSKCLQKLSASEGSTG